MRKDTFFLKRMNLKDKFKSGHVLINVFYLAKLLLYIALSLASTVVVVVIALFVAENVFPNHVHVLNYKLTNSTFNQLKASGHYHEAIYLIENNSDILSDTAAGFQSYQSKMDLSDCYIHVGDYGKAEELLLDCFRYPLGHSKKMQAKLNNLTGDEKKYLAFQQYMVARDLFKLYGIKGNTHEQKHYYEIMQTCRTDAFDGMEADAEMIGVTPGNFNLLLSIDDIDMLRETQPDKAYRQMEQLIDSLENRDDMKKSIMLKQLNKLISWRLEDGDTINSYSTIYRAVKLAKSVGFKDQKEYSQLGCLSDYCYMIHDKGNGKYFLTQYMEYLDDKYEKDDLEYLVNCPRWFRLLEESNDIESLIKEVENCCRGLQDKIDANYQNMSEDEREYFATLLDEPFDYALRLLESHPDDSRLANLCFDNAMFKKGLLLRSNLAIRNAVKNLNNPGLLKDYDKLRKCQKELVARKSLHGLGNTYKSKQLEKEIKELDKKVSGGCAVYLRQNNSDKISREDIQEKMSKDDAVIEFLENRSGVLFALVLPKKGNVQYVRFSTKDELKLIFDEKGALAYMDPGLTAKIFNSDFATKLKDVEKIYFTTSGFFNTLNLTALAQNNGEPMCQKYKFTLMSNVRGFCDLAANSQSFISDGKNGRITLWGGIAYSDTSDLSGNFVNAVPQRGESLCPLPRTKVEVLGIQSVVNRNHILCACNIGKNATEFSFKQRSGMNDMILHIATHGFFKESQQQEDRTAPMFNSGLFFAGANKYWTNDALEVVGEDGILRAAEIAVMDLSQCKLAVLSACNTGVGYNSDEGVYGLQRAFKLAGTDKILMSLWSVDDDCTAKMMQYFYEFLFDGNCTVQEAFENSVEKIRNENGNESPEKWAAFVLLN
ncbi:MAG: CHAT domain-containing protein [Bacteroidales bacterium]|nr:CHAT domain-containing protein [Bacteroidales bacterium]